MTRRKYPSELNTRHVRVNLGDYVLLKEISRRAGVTMAEALHLAVEQKEHETRISPAQTRLPIQTVARSTPITVSFSREVESELRYRHNDR